ncbi:MAG: hypothetical protein ACETVY_02070 [Candidatus Bathyarchaeia archaeon]
MLGPKHYVYAVLAIALGYLLISVVPNQLIPQRYDAFQAEHVKEPGVEEETQPEEPSVTTEPEVLGEAASAAPDEAKAAAEEARAATSGLTIVSEVFTGFGSLLISLFVALGVYWIARRRFV